MSSPLVSIVLLNWNGEKYIHRCLQHIAAQTHSRIELIVVDNGSTDNSLARVKSDYRQAIFIENAENRGYAAGMNQGIASSTGQYVIPLNLDTCLDENFVTRCVQIMEGDPMIGVIGGRVYAWVGEELTDELRKGEGERTVIRKRFQINGGERLDNPDWVFMPSGSYPFFRKATLEDIEATTGYCYDESFGTGWEDLDLAFRLQLLGWKCLFVPEAFGWHVGSGSAEGKATFLEKNTEYQTRVLRNRLFTIYKNLPGHTLRKIAPYLLATELGMLPYLMLRSPRSLRALASAWRQTLDALPELRRKRSSIQQNLRVPASAIERFIEGF